VPDIRYTDPIHEARRAAVAKYRAARDADPARAAAHAQRKKDLRDAHEAGITLPRARRAKTCVICGAAIDDYGHNAAPVAPGLCCAACNARVVLPARLGALP
jgi:hypothetical protein